MSVSSFYGIDVQYESVNGTVSSPVEDAADMFSIAAASACSGSQTVTITSSQLNRPSVGNLTDGSGSQNYVAGQNCQWTVTSPANTFVRMTVRSVQLGADPTTCSTSSPASLVVRDTSSSGPVLFTYAFV